MNCPSCGYRMEQGRLTAGGYRILWTGKARRLSSWPDPNDVLIQKMRLSGRLDNTAYICRTCRKVVVEY